MTRPCDGEWERPVVALLSYPTPAEFREVAALAPDVPHFGRRRTPAEQWSWLDPRVEYRDDNQAAWQAARDEGQITPAEYRLLAVMAGWSDP